MKIAFIINFITHYRLSFYQKLCQNTEQQWLILHGRPQGETGRPSFEGSIPFNNQVIGYQEWKVGPYTIRWQKDIWKSLDAYLPDVVIVLGIPGTISNWLALIWARLRRKKSITWYGGWEAQQGKKLTLMFKKMFLRIFYGLADHVFSYSTKGYNYLRGLGVPDRKISVCYNGIEIDGLEEKAAYYIQKAAALRSERGVQDQIIFLYVGGMLKEKKVDVLIEAFSAVAQKYPTQLWLVGDGPDAGLFKERARQCGSDQIYFLGRIVEDIETYFNAADYFVLPGTGGLAINQALYWGLPCVVGEADGTEDDLVFDGKTGFRFVPDDAASLAAALEKCLTLSPQQCEAFAESGKQLILDRSNVNEMVKHFTETVNRFQDRPAR